MIPELAQSLFVASVAPYGLISTPSVSFVVTMILLGSIESSLASTVIPMSPLKQSFFSLLLSAIEKGS